jgi:hypothetical protein
LVWRQIDGDTILLDLQASRYLTTNSSGSFLLGLLTEEQDRDALVAALVTEYGIPSSVAERDTDGFVDTLRERGLLA